MSRSLPLVVILSVLAVACSAEVPVEEPGPAPTPAAPAAPVEAPPVVPGEVSAPEPAAPVEPPPVPAPEAPEKPSAEPERKVEAPGVEPIAPSADRVTEFVEQLGDREAGRRFEAAVELGKTGNSEAVGPLVTTLQEDKDYFVRRAAARSLGELGFDEAVPALLEALGDKEKFVALSSQKALEKLSGERYETAEEWSAWWDKQKK